MTDIPKNVSYMDAERISQRLQQLELSMQDVLDYVIFKRVSDDLHQMKMTLQSIENDLYIASHSGANSGARPPISAEDAKERIKVALELVAQAKNVHNLTTAQWRLLGYETVLDTDVALPSWHEAKNTALEILAEAIVIGG